MSNTIPFIVSVIAGSSFFPGATKREYKTKVVWTNNAPVEHARALASHDIRALKKIYGADPLEDVPPPGRSAGGGEYPSFEPDRYLVNLPIHGGDQDVGDAGPVEFQEPATRGGDDDEFSLESLGEALSASTRTAREKEVRRMFQSRYAPTKQLSYSREITVVKDIWVLDEDNLTTLKKKIQLATGIPTYRQHLWYELDGVAVSPCFTMKSGNTKIDSAIWNIMDTKSIVSGIPVVTELYAARADLRVRNNEFSLILENILGTCGDLRHQWFVVDINDFITAREQLAGTIRNDIHMRELIYYGFVMKYWPGIPASVFQTFIANEPILHDEYPEFAVSDNFLNRQFGTETSIVAANPAPKPKDIPMNIYLSESDIGIINEYYSYGAAVNVRTLFDNFRLSEETPYMIARFGLGGKTHTLVKNWSSGRGPGRKRHSPVDTVCILTIFPSAEALIYVHVSGTYHTEIMWREDARINIDTARERTIEITNMIIGQINALGETVVARPLVPMTENNINILNTNIVISINRRLTPVQFEGVKENANLFKRAGMLNITSAEGNIFMFHFYKGMHAYDEARFEAISNTNNGYEYTTNIIVQQRHDGIYGRQKLTTVTARNTDIYIHATGIKFSEYATFIKFILILMEMPLSEKIRAVEKSPGAGIKAVSQLRELDPVLYDLKKIYGNKTMYSQICQKPNQPVIVDKPTPKSVKFWNFTKKEPAYYECPGAKYNTLYFKTGVHPAGFCIPCCKKVTVVPGSKHETIFKACTQNHSFDAKAKNGAGAVRSGYIISYAADISPGRISYLPEASLDQLFYQQFSTTGHSVDTECIPDLGYYVFGIDQNIQAVHYVGVVTSLAHALGIPVNEFITETGKRILGNPAAWSLLLGGKITANFKDEKQFIGAAEKIFLTAETIADSTFGVQEWNDVFMDIARVYWEVNIILFLDSGDGNVLIKVPRGIKRAEELVSSQHRHLFLINSPSLGAKLPGQATEIINYVYNPIYQIDTIAFRKNSTISVTLFSSADKIMAVIGKMMTSLISTPGTVGNSVVDLDEAIAWLDSSKNYKIKSILINRSNLCYAVMVEPINGGPALYFPVMISLHDHLGVAREDSEFIRKSYSVPWESLSKLLDDFNAAGAKSAEPKKISPDTWILLDNEIIGFRDAAARFNYYFKPMSLDEARAIASVPAIRIKYDPSDINVLINSRAPAKVEPDLGQYLYKHHGYQLFVLEFVSQMDQKRNKKIRAEISDIVTRDIKNPAAMFGSLDAALADWPRDLEHIVSIFGMFSRVRECRLDEYSALLTKSAGAQFSAEIVNEIIEQSRFEFDDVEMTKMFEMETSAVHDHLVKDILPGVIEIMDSPRVSQFPGGLKTCASSDHDVPEYCRGKKLAVSPKNFETWSKQLALDIKNPLKQRKLIALMTYRASNEFSFTSYPGETIYISIG